MAPIKFEEDIRDTLEKRSIQPSKNAWNTVASNLDAQEKKNSKKTFWMLGIAASIVGVIWISTLFFNNNVEVVTPIIVDIPVIIEEISPLIIEEETKNDDAILIAEISVQEESELQEIASTNEIKKSQKIKKIGVLEYPIIEEELVAGQNEESTPTLTEEDQKIEAIVAQIVELQTQNKNVTDAEIDALLFKAQQEISMKSSEDIETISVSAYALLMDVEQELDPSFRNKVFELLKENYNSVKNTIAQRND